jgi:alanyl-tRNA synthetase
MKSDEVRQTFLRYFKEREHEIIRSSPLIPSDDPTLLFTNAGMNQFKNIFLGNEKSAFKRAASSQKCLRVSGKHNDFEQVGKTARHHTFFEMLGNFSFGDYFKEKAIHYGWELITEVYKISKERLWVTVFEEDDEAFRIWEDKIGLSSSRIVRLGAEDNFWMMGDTGPCGPCSEIHFDQGKEIGCGAKECGVECECDRFVELWNLVFIQSNRKENNQTEPLPAPSIDTGMGLERITAVLQNVSSNYETDLFTPIMDKLFEITGLSYGSKQDVSFRVIADHVRAVSFLIGDGVVPSNDKRGYVLRRILRRAIRHGGLLGVQEPFFHHLTPIVVEKMGNAYPELVESQKYIIEVCQVEEERYARTLAASVHLLEDVMAKRKPEDNVIAGKEIFKLYDTYGLPLDLARDIVMERGYRIDEEGFEKEMEKQRAVSSKEARAVAGKGTDTIYKTIAQSSSTQFVGYEQERAYDCRVVEIIQEGKLIDHLSKSEEGEVILDKTPFYGESGGQVGDQGYIVTGGSRCHVFDTIVPLDGLIVHRVKVEDGSIRKGDKGTAEIDRMKRRKTMRNHTATHLLHAALREVVGPHIKQAGSLVEPKRLRFDFTHYAALPEEALEEIEEIVNGRIIEDIPVTREILPYKEALLKGVMALFDEKYGEMVRVIRIGEVSAELCGGTHCQRIGEIGLFKILSERSIASGIRRIEAVTGDAAFELLNADHKNINKIRMLLNVLEGDPAESVQKRLAEIKSLRKELERLRLKGLSGELETQSFEREEVIRGHRVIVKRVDDLKKNEMRSMADHLKKKLKSGVIILCQVDEDKISLLVGVTDDLEKKFHAGKIVKEMSAAVGGKGGGRSLLAEGGGKSVEKLEEAIDIGLKVIEDL